MRERIEDLGRILVLIRKLLDHNLFDESDRPRRPKDTHEFIEDLSKEKIENLLSNLFYGIRDVEEELLEILSIAEGTDHLNEMIDL